MAPRDADTVQREMRLAAVLREPVRAVWWLLGVNIAIWVVGFGWGASMGIESPYFNNEQLTLYTGMKVNELLAGGEWWRLLSSQFVHLDVLHIMFNGYGLYMLGPLIERFYGWRRFLLLYLASGTVGALASFYFTEMPSGGASGAIYGLVGALLVFGLKHRKDLPERVSRAFTVGLLPWVVFGIGIGFLESLPMDNAAHLGGLVCGGAMVFLLRSKLRKRHRFGEWAVTALTVVALIALAWMGVEWGLELWNCAGDRAAYFECYPELESQLLGQ